MPGCEAELLKSIQPSQSPNLKTMAQKAGVTVKEEYWTLGAHDIVAIVEAPDDTAVTALALSTGALGNVHTQTLRAFSKAEMTAILGKMV